MKKRGPFRLGRPPAGKKATVAKALVATWGWQTLLALLASWPAASLVRASLAGDPEPDTTLWKSGSRALAFFLWREAHGVSASLETAAFVLVVGAVIGLVATAALMFVLSGEGEAKVHAGDGSSLHLGDAVADGMRVFSAFAGLLVVFTSAQAATLAAAYLGAMAVESLAHHALGEAPAEQLGVATAAALSLGVVWLAVAHDVARAAVVRGHVGVVRSLGVAFYAITRKPWSTAWAFAWRGALSLLAVAVTAPLALRLGPGMLALGTLAVAHQAVIGVRVALRASWLAQAIRSVNAVEEPDKFVRSGGQAVPSPDQDA